MKAGRLIDPKHAHKTVPEDSATPITTEKRPNIRVLKAQVHMTVGTDMERDHGPRFPEGPLVRPRQTRRVPSHFVAVELLPRPRGIWFAGRIIYCENQTRLTAGWLDKRRHRRSVNHLRIRVSRLGASPRGHAATSMPSPLSPAVPLGPVPLTRLFKGTTHRGSEHHTTWKPSRSHRGTSRMSVYGPVRRPILSTCYLPLRVPRSLSHGDLWTTPSPSLVPSRHGWRFFYVLRRSRGRVWSCRVRGCNGFAGTGFLWVCGCRKGVALRYSPSRFLLIQVASLRWDI